MLQKISKRASGGKASLHLKKYIPLPAKGAKSSAKNDQTHKVVKQQPQDETQLTQDPHIQFETFDEEPVALKLVAAVQDMIDSQKSLRHQLEVSRKENATLRKLINDKELEGQQMQKLLDSKNQELKRTHDELIEKSMRLDQLSEDHQALKVLADQQARQFKNELAHAAEKYEVLLKELENKIMSKDKVIFTLENTIKSLEFEKTTLEEKCEQLRFDNENLIRNISGFAENSLGSLSSSEYKYSSKTAVRPEKPEIAPPKND